MRLFVFTGFLAFIVYLGIQMPGPVEDVRAYEATRVVEKYIPSGSVVLVDSETVISEIVEEVEDEMKEGAEAEIDEKNDNSEGLLPASGEMILTEVSETVPTVINDEENDDSAGVPPVSGEVEEANEPEETEDDSLEFESEPELVFVLDEEPETEEGSQEEVPEIDLVEELISQN